MAARGSTAPSLAQIQSLFFRALTWPTGTEQFLAAADASTRAEFKRVFAGTPSFDRIARVDVYADAYFYRILGALREMFPRLCYLAGDAPFHNLITDYLVAYPSTTPDLRRAGDCLPFLLQDHALGRHMPFLPDIAELEHALNHALDCPDGERLGESDLARIPIEAWPRLGFSLAVATRLVNARWNLTTICEHVERGERDAALAVAREVAPHALLVGRRGHATYFRALERFEQEALAAFAGGLCFEAVCGALAHDHPDFEPRHMVEHLRRWLADGVIGSVALHDT